MVNEETAPPVPTVTCPRQPLGVWSGSDNYDGAKLVVRAQVQFGKNVSRTRWPFKASKLAYETFGQGGKSVSDSELSVEQQISSI